MADHGVNQVARDQFARAFAMLENAIAAFPDESWRECGGCRPAGISIHILETVEFYMSGKPAENFEWGHRFGLDWEGAPAPELPNKADVTAYLHDVKDASEQWLIATDLMAAESSYVWTGKSVLDRTLYVLRNTLHHIGQLALALRTVGAEPPEWQ